MAETYCDNTLPSVLNDSDSFRRFISYVSRGAFVLLHKTKTTELVDQACVESERMVSC